MLTVGIVIKFLLLAFISIYELKENVTILVHNYKKQCTVKDAHVYTAEQGESTQNDSHN